MESKEIIFKLYVHTLIKIDKNNKGILLSLKKLSSLEVSNDSWSKIKTLVYRFELSTWNSKGFFENEYGVNISQGSIINQLKEAIKQAEPVTNLTPPALTRRLSL